MFLNVLTLSPADDSIYTERYMKTPALNPQGYQEGAVHISSSFHNTPFLLAQGSGDDNVHFENSAHLLDLLTQEQVRNFRFRMFTDSDHSIQMRGGYRELHEWMTAFLREKWGAGGRRKKLGPVAAARQANQPPDAGPFS